MQAQYHVGCSSPLPLANDELLSMAHIQFGPWDVRFDHWSSHFPAKSTDQHQMAIQMMSSICDARSPAKFLSIKTTVLWVASSLWADIDLVRTIPEVNVLCFCLILHSVIVPIV